MRQIKVLNLNLFRVLPSFHHYILAYLGIHGIITIGQIKDGRYMYRALEAHFSLYFALYKLHMSKFVDDNQKTVVNAISDVSDSIKEKNDVIKQKHTSYLETLKNIGLFRLI